MDPNDGRPSTFHSRKNWRSEMSHQSLGANFDPTRDAADSSRTRYEVKMALIGTLLVILLVGLVNTNAFAVVTCPTACSGGGNCITSNGGFESGSISPWSFTSSCSSGNCATKPCAGGVSGGANRGRHATQGTRCCANEGYFSRQVNTSDSCNSTGVLFYR